MKEWVAEALLLLGIIVLFALLAWRVYAIPIQFEPCSVSSIKPYAGVCR